MIQTLCFLVWALIVGISICEEHIWPVLQKELTPPFFLKPLDHNNLAPFDVTSMSMKLVDTNIMDHRKLATPSILVSDMQILEMMYNSMRGTGWIWKTPYTSYGIPWDMSNPQPCQNSWQGIRCMCINTTCVVTHLSLPGYNLDGYIPPSMGFFPYLGYMDISNNKITGIIPSQVGYLTNMQYLDLSSNFISGGIPSSVSSLTNLLVLDLASNAISGTIHTQLGTLTKLQKLVLSLNHLHGTIPSQIFSSPYLGYLDLSVNAIYGTIPTAIGNVAHLQYLDFSFNSLGGTIPTEVGNLRYLQYISLYTHNVAGLTGTIPTEIAKMTSLVYLILGRQIDLTISPSYTSENLRISGTISTAISQLTNLEYLYIYGAQLTGTVPSFIGDMTKLQAVVIGSNYLNGTMPSSLSKLYGLRYLVVGACSLTGTMPDAVGNLSSLFALSMNSNNFGGTLPESWAALRKLGLFYVYNNRLTGTIPTVYGNMHNLRVFISHGNMLTGHIPSELSNLRNLSDMNLAHNLLSSSIPTEIGGMSLGLLEISDNQLTGALPSELGKLSKLGILNATQNAFHGILPSQMGKLRQLAYLNIQSNHFSGSLSDALASLTNLKFIDLSHNLFSGSIPTWIDKLVSVETIDVRNNSFSGSIPTTIGKLHQTLKYVDFSFNSMRGSLPSEFYQLTSLQYMNMISTPLRGSIAQAVGNLSSLLNIRVQANQLIGSIPSSLADIPNLALLDLSSNSLTGSIPSSIRNINSLRYLFLQNNQLKGKLNNIFNVTSQPLLANIDISNNAISGTLKEEIFQLPSLKSFAAVKNCMSGTLPPEICDAVSIEALALDGMSTAEHCQIQYTALGVINSYGLSTSLTGTIPRCIFAMPRLHTLHLSGNGIRDSIPRGINISDSLQDLSLSHNRMYGTIPNVIQERAWRNLDLSFNKFYGSLSSNLHPVASDAALRLLVNRLSGSVPASIRYAKNLSVLDGNLFECDVFAASSTESKLPVHDESTAVYQCADTFQQLSYAWGAPFVLSVMVTVVLFILYNVARSTMEKVRQYAVLAHQWLEELDKEKKSLVSGQRTSSIYLLKKFLMDWQYTCLLISGYNFFILMPTWFILTQFYNTYAYEYSWSASMAYLSGLIPTVVSIILLTISLAILFTLSTTNAVRHRQRRTSNFVAVLMQESVGMKICSASTVVFVILFNFVVVLSVNVLYVYVTVTYGEEKVTAAAVGLVVFKLIWSELVIERSCRAGLLHLKKTFPDELVKIFDRRVLITQCYLSLANNIVIPFLATGVVSSTCFLYFFRKPESVVTSYTFDQCVVQSTYEYLCTNYETVDVCNILSGVEYGCSGNVVAEASTSYTPPFEYSFQCSGTFLSSYAAVYVYGYVLVAFAPPLIGVILTYISKRVTPNGLIYDAIMVALPNHMRADTKPIQRMVFDKRQFVVRALNDTAMLIAFGGVFPPLAFVIYMAILSRILYVLMGLGRILKFYDDNDCTDNKATLLHNCQDIPEIFSNLIWLLLPFTSVFYAFFLFDTYGEAVGGQRALWAPLLMIAMPLLFWLCRKVIMRPEFKEYREWTRMLFVRWWARWGSSVDVDTSISGKESGVDNVKPGMSRGGRGGSGLAIGATKKESSPILPSQGLMADNKEVSNVLAFELVSLDEGDEHTDLTTARSSAIVSKLDEKRDASGPALV